MQIYKHIPETHNKNAASIILPEVLRIVNPNSIIDVGCGTGTFLSVLQDLGYNDVMGIEGEWLDNTKLYVDRSIIKTFDLRNRFTVNRKFDLAISLEVAEHLPESSADTFVDTLTNLSDVILFSAAIPNQGGQNHLNEQWPDYWLEKFSLRKYSFYDGLRWKFWNNPKVEYWYSQNIFMIIKDNTNDFGLKKVDKPVSAIHPDLFNLARKSEWQIAQRYKDVVWGNRPIGFYAKLLLKSVMKKLHFLEK